MLRAGPPGYKATPERVLGYLGVQVDLDCRGMSQYDFEVQLYRVHSKTI